LSSLDSGNDGAEVTLGESAGFFRGDPAFGEFGSPEVGCGWLAHFSITADENAKVAVFEVGE